MKTPDKILLLLSFLIVGSIVTFSPECAFADDRSASLRGLGRFCVRLVFLPDPSALLAGDAATRTKALEEVDAVSKKGSAAIVERLKASGLQAQAWESMMNDDGMPLLFLSITGRRCNSQLTEMAKLDREPTKSVRVTTWTGATQRAESAPTPQQAIESMVDGFISDYKYFNSPGRKPNQADPTSPK